MQTLNLRALKVFQMVMEKGSVTHAATALNITQPAVSKTISQLQESLGLSLFGRLNGRLHPSRDAHRLYAEARGLFEHVSLMEHRITGLREGHEGNLAVSAIPTLAISVVAAAVSRFAEGHNDLHVQLSSQIATDVVENVNQLRVDIGFAHSHQSVGGAVETAIGESEVVCLMNRDHPAVAHEVLTPELLRNEPLIFLDKWAPPSLLVRECFAAAGVSPKVVVEVNSTMAAKTIVRIGSAIAIVDPWPMLIEPAHDILIKPFRPRVPLRIVGLHSPRLPMSNTTRRFIDLVRAEVVRGSKLSEFVRAYQGS